MGETAQAVLMKSKYKVSKAEAREAFDGSLGLFEACWRQYREYLRGAIDYPESLNDVSDWLDQIASEKVNDSTSRFYIYG